MPLISIILPTYNVEKYIARALESCINQTLKDIEIIVVDDKGQDNSIDIAKNYAIKDSRINIIDNKINQGPYNARVNGIKKSKSDYIMFLDPDDELNLQACEIAFKSTNQSIDIVFFNAFAYFNEKQTQIWNYHCDYEIIKVKDKPNFMIDFGWSMWNKLYNKKILLNTIEKIPYFDGKMAEDFLFNCICSNLCSNIAIINKPLYKYYYNNNSTTSTKNIRSIIMNLKSYKKVSSLINNNILDTKLKKQMLNVLNKEYYTYGANNIKFDKNHKILSFILLIKYKFMKKVIKCMNN